MTVIHLHPQNDGPDDTPTSEPIPDAPTLYMGPDGELVTGA